MGKHSSEGTGAFDQPRKRRKVVHEAATHEKIRTSRQLQQLSTFDQDLNRARHGLQSFKVFLDVILSDGDDHEENDQILNEYLTSIAPQAGQDAPTYLYDVMETWSFAAQTNHDSVLSAVPVVLELLLKVLSRKLETVAYGLGICRTLLLKRQQELLARNLSADKGKEFIISPTLRLLQQALCFDGGIMAMPIFRARIFTFRSLARNMGIKYLGEGYEDPKRPSGRTNAVRFLLSALKYLHHDAKRELLHQRDLVFALTRLVKDDPPYLILEILAALKAHVLLEKKLSRDAKGKLLNSSVLTRISGLYNFARDTLGSGNQESVVDAAQGFLETACTVQSAGLLRDQSGFYPRGFVQETEAVVAAQGSMDDLGSQGVLWMDKFNEGIPVFNVVLSEFIQNLRPWSSTKQVELIISIFNAAPELIADYFLQKKSFTFDGKLSATWLGYASFLFNVVILDIPRYFGHESGYSQFPPPTSIVLNNVLPLPLNQKVLMRNLSQKSNLITFFTARILVIALEKLDKVIKMHHEAAESGKKALWVDATRRLIDGFSQKCPGMKDVVTSYRAVGEDYLHRETACRLIRRYYEVLPQVALVAKFDVSLLLMTVVKRLENGNLEDDRDFLLSIRELEHLLSIASYSPGMRWFAKIDGFALSPFMTLLKLSADIGSRSMTDTILRTLQMVATELQLVFPSTTIPGFSPLIQCVHRVHQDPKAESNSEIWTFVDNCASRCANTPIKYLEMAEDLIEKETQRSVTSERHPIISPVTMAMFEQLSFFTTSYYAANSNFQATLSDFLVQYVELSRQRGEDAFLLDSFLNKLRATFSEKSQTRASGRSSSLEALSGSVEAEHHLPLTAGEIPALRESSFEHVAVKLMEEVLAEHSTILDSNTSALTRWSTKTVDELIDEGHIVSLVSLLVSEHKSIRKEALTNILKMGEKIRQSDYDEKDQCGLLLSELAETAKDHIELAPMPTPLVAFACHALDVLKAPLHNLYGKINHFLTRAPAWTIDKLPLVHEILQEEPAGDDTYYSELSWLLTYFLDSLRTPDDLALFHKTRTFERLLSLASNPFMRTPLRLQVLKVIYRATGIAGGSTTLTTRFGIVSWLQSQAVAASDEDAWIYKALIERIWKTVDQDRVQAWSRGGIGDVVDN